MKSCLYPILVLCYGEKHPGEASDAKPASETVEVLHWMRLRSRAWTSTLCFLVVKSIWVKLLTPSHHVRLLKSSIKWDCWSLAWNLTLCFLVVKSIRSRLLMSIHQVRQLKSHTKWGYEAELEPHSMLQREHDLVTTPLKPSQDKSFFPCSYHAKSSEFFNAPEGAWFGDYNQMVKTSLDEISGLFCRAFFVHQ